MKLITLSALFLSLTYGVKAQEAPTQSIRWPITITLFSESISLPNFRNVFKNGNLGIRVGTEFYYRQNKGRQLLQTINVGYYKHRGFQTGLYVSSEFGYRKLFGRAFADGTVGLGYLLAHSALPRYERVGTEYKSVSSLHHKVTPTLGFGAGYQFDQFSIFGRYEAFGEMPFGLKGIPALPHKAIHVGTRINIK